MRRRAFACAIVIAAAVLTGASEQPADKPQLHFIAIGKVPSDLIDHVATHFQTKLGVPINVLLPLGADRLAFDAERSQMVADRLIQAVRFRHPTLAKSSRTRIIAITSSDIYMEAMRDKWAFTFALRSKDQRLAVVSYARMDPAVLGDRADEALLRSRLRKMIAKNIGIMYFGLPVNDNPRSALFRNVLGVDDLDRMTEEFDPK